MVYLKSHDGMVLFMRVLFRPTYRVVSEHSEGLRTKNYFSDSSFLISGTLRHSLLGILSPLLISLCKRLSFPFGLAQFMEIFYVYTS